MLRDIELTPPLPAAWVTLAEAKAHLDIAGTASDDKITAMLAPACATIEAYAGTVIAQRTVVERLALACEMRSIVLRYSPAIAVSAVAYDDTTQTLGDYRLAKATGILRHVDNNEFAAVADWVVTYTAGFATVPDPIKRATLDLLKHMREMSARSETVVRESVPDVGEVDYADAGAALVTGNGGAQVPPSVATALAPYVLRFSS